MSRRIPDWLAKWLGVAPDTAGEGTTWQLETQWGWAPWVTLLAALAIVGWVVLWYSRESANVSRRYKTMLVTLRLLAIAVLAVMLTELLISLKRTGLPAVVLLVDRSAFLARRHPLEPGAPMVIA